MNLQAINNATQGKTRTGGISPFSEIEVSRCYPNQNQPRKSFENIEELAESIKQDGLIQPIAVVKKENGRYMIVSGERRYRATKYAGLKTIKAHILDIDDAKVQELALVENIQREDLTDYEKAKYIAELLATGHYKKKQDLAKAIGKPQSYISKALKAVKLCDEIIEEIESNRQEVGLEILQELSAVKDKELQLQLFKRGAKREEIREVVNDEKSSTQKSAKFSPAKKQTQLYAMIKKSSDHYSQQSYHTDQHGKQIPFEIFIPTSHSAGGEAIGGVGGNYHLEELYIYVMINNEYVRLN